ncbi:MAG: ABC transporter substrate-binding protein [Paracoccaceae bacterium]|nr:ABC transporter substrate-binding protein [Paracoccaceae bacterium]
MKKASYLKTQAARLRAGEINRRRFIMSAMATGVTMPTAMSLATRAEALTPKKGGLFRYGTGLGSKTDLLDPARSENHMTSAINQTRGNTLTEIENTGALIGALAESFEASDAGRTWVFDLRPGVTFHNEKALTAEDVIATMRFHGRKGSRSAARGLLAQIARMRKDGDRRVIFELHAANSDFPYIVSDDHLIILPSEDGEVDPLGTTGTGAYILNCFEPGVRAGFYRNPNYWRSDRAHFDAVEMISIPDTTARQNAVMNGDVDFIDNVDPKTVALLERAPTLDILQTTGTQHYTFPMRLDVAPFDNHDLRVALKHAIKRQELVDKVLLGHGAAGNDVPVNDSMPFFNTDLPALEFDPETAAEHYKKSGHAGPILLSASDAAFPGAADAARLLADSAAEAGIEIEVAAADVGGKPGWCAGCWGGRPTQDWMYLAGWTRDAAWDDTGFTRTKASERFHDVVAKARSDTDPASRKDLYWEAQRLLQNDSGAIVAMWADHIHAHSRTLAHDDAVAANWPADGARIAERWWFA